MKWVEVEVKQPSLVWSMMGSMSFFHFVSGAYVPEGLLTSCTWDYMTFTPSVRAYTMLLFIFVFFLPLFIIIYCYVLIFRAIRTTNQSVCVCVCSNKI